MNEKEKQRRIGQIMLVCKIIKLENENLRRVPRVHVSDIERWLDTDEQYVATLINVCSSFDKRNIADDVLNSMHIYDDVNKRYPASSFVRYFGGKHLVVINKEELNLPLNKEDDLFLFFERSPQV